MQSSNEDFVRHTVVFNVSKTWGRIGMLSRTYSTMAETALRTFLTAQKDPLLENADEELHMEREEVRHRILTTAIQSIVFSAMACEAAIYDLAAIHLGEKSARLIDKLDVIGKWAMVPRLICGKSLDLNGHAIQSLRKLVTARNELVHYKSMPFVPDEEAFAKADKRVREIYDAAKVGFEAMVSLSLELTRTVGTPTGVLPFYENSFNSDEFSEELLDLLNHCRKIEGDAKARQRNSA